MKKIWVFCFEYAGVAKLGGLGEVSANQSRSLVHEPELELNVFMPSHGRHRELKSKYGFSPLTEANGEKLILKGHFDPSFFGLSYGDEIHARTFTKFQSFSDLTYFEIEIWKGIVEDVPVHLLVGANPISARIMNDHDIYGSSTLNAKLGLFSLAMREYMRYIIFKVPENIPNIIHIHDHHPVGALLCCRQELNLVGKDVRSIITMHLLTWPHRAIDFFWKSGVNNELMLVQIGIFRIWKRMSDIFEICKNNELKDPTLEKIGCAVADRVIAVSENFLQSDIIPFCGGDIIRWKCDFTWNGCDWDYKENREKVWQMVGKYFPNKSIEEIYSWDFRKLLLEQMIGKLPEGEPKISSSEVKSLIAKECSALPYHPDGTVDAFSSDGPLVLITGRISPQKGIETLFAAIPTIINIIPNVKFLFLMVPTPYASSDLQEYMNFARKYPDNVRFIFGVAGSIYFLAHLSADVYCCPSRWEPFGIVALEAMVSRIPVVATSTGGLMESILHLEDHPEDGTGLLVPVDNSEEIKFAIISLLNVLEISRDTITKNHNSPEYLSNLLDYIIHPILHAYVRHDPLYGEKIRDSALKRVETSFRWTIVSQKLKRVYLSLNY